jgi:hypothetical protein
MGGDALLSAKGFGNINELKSIGQPFPSVDFTWST